MTIAAKIAEIGKNFPYTTYVIYTLNGNTGRIVDFTDNLTEALSYITLGKKNGMACYVAEYNPKTNVICYDFN